MKYEERMTFSGNTYRLVVVNPRSNHSLGVNCRDTAADCAKWCNAFGFWRIKSIKETDHAA